MNILALDLATETGWAHSSGASGVKDFKPRRGDSPGMKWINFETWLYRTIKTHEVDVIVYEQAHHRGGAATHSAHSFIGLTEKEAAEYDIEITSRHTATIKKHATGNGRASKEEMLAAARERWPDIDIIDDNQADALWLLDLVQEELGQ